MEVFVTGGSGFVGQALCRALVESEYQVTVLSRSAEKASQMPKNLGQCLGDPTKSGPWQEEAARHKLIINLAGASIFGRWNADYKKLIHQSRVLTTQNLVKAIESSSNPEETVLISTSAVGYYGFSDDRHLTEESPPGNDFLARVCVDWESEAKKAEASGARVAITRFGVILGPNGGALKQMLPIFKKGLGGPLGSGKQWFSWIHLEDLVRGLLFVAKNQHLKGPVNLSSPNPVTNRAFTKALGQALNRPVITPVPAFAAKLAMGEFAQVLLNGQRVIPKVLFDAGFEFLHPEVDEALKTVVPK